MDIASELRDLLVEVAGDAGTPGLAAGVLVDGEVHAAGHGITSVEHPLDVDPGTLFQVGSISKTFTSAAVMTLVEEGRVGLDDPVARYLPDLGPATGLDTEAMTVEHLLSHQSGFDGDHLFTMRESEELDELASARHLFAPGDGVSYSNAGFTIAGAVIEAVTGTDFEEVIRSRLLRPLGMRSAGFTADRAITNRVAVSHVVLEGEAQVLRGGMWQKGWQLGTLDRPAGGLIASIDHLLRWCRFQIDGRADDGARILSDTSLERLHTPVAEMTSDVSVALDWFVRRTDGSVTIDHGGETPGYCSDLVVVPDQGIGVVCLTNGTDGAVPAERVRRAVLERFAGLVEVDPEPDPSRAIDADQLTGRYLHAFGWIDVGPGEAPGTLVMETTARDDVEWQPPEPPPVTIGAAGPDHFVTLDAPGRVRVVRFATTGDRPAPWLLSGFRRALRAE